MKVEAIVHKKLSQISLVGFFIFKIIFVLNLA
jgi:hypothetical protein